MRAFWILPLFILFFFGNVSSQDFHLSQYDEATHNLSPALTGMFNGRYRVHSHYRTQWMSIASKPFVTTALSGDLVLKKVSVGAEIINQRAGSGGYNVFGLLLSGAFDKPVGKKGYHRISCGLQAGFVHKSVNLSKLLFGNQYVTTNGGGFDNSMPNNEFNFDQSVLMHDVNAGLVYYYAKSPARFNPFIGITVFHLSQAKESFFGENNTLPMRYLAFAGCKIVLSEKIQLMPRAMFMQQVNARELVTGMDLHFFLKESDAYIILGGSHRSLDALIPMVGLKYGNYTYKVSYDINTSSLKPTTNGRGGFEFSVTLIGAKPKPAPIPNCPRS